MKKLDIVVFKVVNYFAATFTTWAKIACKMGAILAVVGIAWTGIQIATSTMEVRKGLIGIVTRFCLFFLAMTFYPAFTNGLQQFAVGAAQHTGVVNLQDLKSNLTAFYNNLADMCKSDLEDLNELYGYLEQLNEADEDVLSFEKYNFQTVLVYRDDVESNIANYESSTNIRLLLTMKQVFCYEDESGELNEIISDYYTFNMDNMLLKDSEGNETGYISPEALYKINLMAADIMWAKQSISSDGKSWLTEIGEKFTVGFWIDLLLTGFTCLIIIITSIASLIQYIMAIIEYSITSSLAVILVPCLLFDGVKDMASKILPSLFSQAMKLCLCTLAVYYCAFSYINMAIENFNGFKMSLDIFGQVVFTCLLNFCVCANAPKIAVTLMTGQPQLSMGEVVQAFGAALGGVRAADNFAHKAKGAASKMTGATISAMGDIAANNSAASAAWDAAEARGDSDGKVLASAAGMWVNQGWENMKRRTQAGLSDFAHGGGKGGGSGSGGGAGDNRYAWTSDDPNGDGGKTGLTNSMNYQTAKTADDKGYLISQTAGEFLDMRREAARKRANEIEAEKAKKRQEMYKDDNMPENPGHKNSSSGADKENKNA